MPSSSSEDQLDTMVLSGKEPSCSAVLATCEKYIRVCWHRACFRRGAVVPTVVYITHFRWACHISTVWRFEQSQNRSKGGIHYRRITLPACQVSCRSLSCCIYYVSVGGNERERDCYCVSIVFVWFARVYAFIIANIWWIDCCNCLPKSFTFPGVQALIKTKCSH